MLSIAWGGYRNGYILPKDAQNSENFMYCFPILLLTPGAIHYMLKGNKSSIGITATARQSIRKEAAGMKKRTYIAIDLKSFYASVECRERGLDPLDTHLVVADEKRTDKTICLAVTPSLKSYGISGRSRLFEVRQRVREVNAARRNRTP